MSNKNSIFKKRIGEIFRGISYYDEDQAKRTIDFKVDWSEISYDLLCQLSEVLDTTKISARFRYSEGCPTCGGDYTTEISATEVVF
jgi:DnaJ-class molecular chaperone